MQGMISRIPTLVRLVIPLTATIDSYLISRDDQSMSTVCPAPAICLLRGPSAYAEQASTS